MKKIPVFLFFLVCINQLIANPILEDENFSLQFKFDENVVVKEAKLTKSDGTEYTLEYNSKIISGNIDFYSSFYLNLNLLNKSTGKEENIYLTVILVPGETTLRFKKIPGQFEISGASQESYNAYSNLVAKDESAYGKVRRANSQLTAGLKKNDKLLIAKLKQAVSKAEEERNNLYTDFIKNNPASAVSLYAIGIFGTINFESPLVVEKAINLLDEKLQGAEQIIELKQRVESNKKIMVGQPAPAIAQVDTSGNIISLDDLKGKYVFVDFWASWCKPCREQNPQLIKLYNKFKSDQFTIIGVSLDSYKSAWIKAINDDKLEWLNISDLKGWKNEAAILYNISSVPQNYLLDKNGIIIAKNISEEELFTKLSQILSLKPQQ